MSDFTKCAIQSAKISMAIFTFLMVSMLIIYMAEYMMLPPLNVTEWSPSIRALCAIFFVLSVPAGIAIAAADRLDKEMLK